MVSRPAIRGWITIVAGIDVGTAMGAGRGLPAAISDPGYVSDADRDVTW